MTDEHDNFKVGDVVMCPWGRGHIERGTVRKVTPSTVTVDKASGGSETYRRRKYGRAFECRHRTDADQRQDDYEAAFAAWRLQSPVCKLVKPRGGREGVRVVVDVQIESDIEFDGLLTELAEVREWLRKRPEEPR